MALKNRLYPHMMPDEIPIWERWLLKNPDRFDSLDYDVRVGTVISVPEEIPENIKQDAEILSLKRIDVVGYKMGKATILEVKKIIAFKALGQAIGYPIMFARLRGLEELPEVILIGEQIDEDMAAIMDLIGIRFDIV